jgi:hypothetical protein
MILQSLTATSRGFQHVLVEHLDLVLEPAMCKFGPRIGRFKRIDRMDPS